MHSSAAQTQDEVADTCARSTEVPAAAIMMPLLMHTRHASNEKRFASRWSTAILLFSQPDALL